MRGCFAVVSAVVLSVLMQGCGGATGNGDPGARALPAGESCQSIRGELNRLELQGCTGAGRTRQQRRQAFGIPAGRR